MRKVAHQRREFVREARHCWACGGVATDCHEIASGTHRQAALDQRLAWLALCRICNCHQMTDKAVWSLPRQLALKWIYDRRWFDLPAFNRLRGRAPNAITFNEVVLHICRQLDGRQA